VLNGSAMKLLRKFHTAIWVRCETMAKYAFCAPSILLIVPWLKAAMVRTRLCQGAAVGRLELALAKKAGEIVSLDCASESEMDIFREVVVCGNYPFDKLPFTPVLVADCGANVGYFSCLARVAFPEALIYAWEPDAKNFRRLSEQPILHTGKTTLANAAVSDHVGRVSLTGAGHGCEVKAESDGSEAVECIDFGAWWRKHNRSYALLKMDIEGHENIVLPALRGSWQAPCAVFLETHAPRGADDDVIKRLQADGFRVELLRSHSLPRDERVFKEYLALLS
jgi:FkbM family methyltransferase